MSLRACAEYNQQAGFRGCAHLHPLVSGNITSYQILGRSVVVLNSVQAAFDLLDKRSANFSDRPCTPVTELIGWNGNFSLQQYGQSWRSHRRLFWQHLNPGRLNQYDDTQHRESIQFLRKILDKPSGLEEHTRQ
ncbi:hypothetical protein BD309DRAFT_878533 [Dichomitus squalens]|nr:hypothetical protein BD309DRAFT_878533 [Dichomitus squalens]